MESIRYKRVLLKLSGESLAGGASSLGIDYKTVKKVCLTVKECVSLGVQFSLVIGGGNFWRGRTNSNIDNSIADQMGMLATILNAIYLREVFEHVGIDARVMSTIPVTGIVKNYDYKHACELLNEGKVLIFAGGTGGTHFSTDSAASLRAAELGADVLLKATMVDGVYDCDPKVNKDAKIYSTLSYGEVLAKNLKFMDSTAIAMCKDNNIKVLVFSISNVDNIKKAVFGEKIGTLISD